MFDSTRVTNSYNKLINYSIKDYNFMKNIFGISESFGYWTGFTMSAFLLLSSLIISFIYKIKLDKVLKGAKKGVVQLLPMIFYSIISLTIIVLSLKNNGSFIYSIINRLFKMKNDTLGLLFSGILHNFFINDYFALTSSLSTPLVTVYSIDNISNSLFTTQVAHGIASMISPFNVFLIAGLTYLKIPYTKWLKYIIKFLLLVIMLSIVVLLITKSF
jgi:uncharacterized ion transporter superfamily protein YfcC